MPLRFDSAQLGRISNKNQFESFLLIAYFLNHHPAPIEWAQVTFVGSLLRSNVLNDWLLWYKKESAIDPRYSSTFNWYFIFSASTLNVPYSTHTWLSLKSSRTIRSTIWFSRVSLNKQKTLLNKNSKPDRIYLWMKSLPNQKSRERLPNPCL